MNNDLTILPVVPEENEIEPNTELHPNLPDIYKAQLICCVGPVRSGKGVLWNTLIHNPNFYENLFSNVTVISPTIFNDSTSRFTLAKYKDTCFDAYDNKIIDDLIQNQKNKKKIDGTDSSYCLIIDDCYGEFDSRSSKNGSVIRLASRFRHYVNKGDACLYLYNSQKYLDCATILRANMTGFCVSGMIRNKKELEAIKYDIDDLYTGHFDEIMARAQGAPYQWIYFRLASTPPQAFLNFTEQIY